VAHGRFRIDGGGESSGIALMLESEMNLRPTDIPHNPRCVFAGWLQLPDKMFEPGLHSHQIRITHRLVGLHRAGHQMRRRVTVP
jgi:hypothetical protein